MLECDGMLQNTEIGKIIFK